MVNKRNDNEDQVKATLNALEADGDDGDNTSIISRVRDISKTQLSGNRRKVQTEEALEDWAKELRESEHGDDNLKIWQALFPAESDFSLTEYEKNPKYKENRDMDDHDRAVAAMYDKDGKYKGNAGRGVGNHVNPYSAAAATVAATLGTVGAVQIRERQQKFYDSLPEAERKTGIPSQFIGAMWGNESSFGTKLLSSTGCLGDGQFSRGTWAAIVRQYGDHMPGLEKYAVGLRNGTIKPSDEGLQAARVRVENSADSMSFLAKEIAKDMGVDPTDKKNWGIMYAAYVVGPQAAKKMRANTGNDQSALALLGDVAQKNPMFFDKGRANSAQALANFQSIMMASSGSFDKQIVAKLGADASIAKASASSKDAVSRDTSSVASAVNGPAISSSVKPKAEFSDAKTDAKAKEAADAVVKTAESEVGKFQKFKTMLYGYVGLDDDAKPAPKVSMAKPKIELVPHIYG